VSAYKAGIGFFQIKIAYTSNEGLITAHVKDFNVKMQKLKKGRSWKV